MIVHCMILGKDELEKLRRFQERTLDLTARNRRIDSKFNSRTKQHFRIIDEVPEDVYDNINRFSMSFAPLPPIEKKPSDKIKREDDLQIELLPPIEKEPRDETGANFKEKLKLAKHTDIEYLNKIDSVQGNPDEKYKLERGLKNRVREELGMSKFHGKDISLADHAKKHGINPDYELPKIDSDGDKKYVFVSGRTYELPKKIETIAERNEVFVNGRTHELPKIDSDGDKKRVNKKIQTFLLEDQLNSYINTIWKTSKSSQKESGVNPIYICFGFLEWRQSDAAEKTLTSPLLMLQVNLEEAKKKGQLLVSSTGDDIAINLTLNEKLKRESKMELPTIPENSDKEDTFSVEDYFEAVEKLASPRNWKLKRWVSFGIYDANNMPIYVDIERIEKENSKLLIDLLTGTKEGFSQGNRAEYYEVDAKKNQKKLPALVRSADSSQFSAVLDAINGKNIVLKGPPGTGKSQTITNIIAALCSEGKKVLFIAQKQAALDVVRNNLEAVGLKDYLLETFTIKGKKKAVMESIRRRYKKAKPGTNSSFENKLDQLNKVKEDLNKYANAINSPYEKTGKTIHEILWDQVVEVSEPSLARFDNFEVKNPEKISKSVLEEGISQLQQVRDFCERDLSEFDVFSSKIRKIKKKISSPAVRKRKIEEITRYSESFSHLFYALGDCLAKNLISVEDFKKKPLIRRWCSGEEGNRESLKYILLSVKEDLKTVKDYIQNKKKHEDATRKFKEKINISSKKFRSLKNLEEAASQLKRGTSFFLIFTGKWWAARKTFNTLCTPASKKRKLTSIQKG